MKSHQFDQASADFVEVEIPDEFDDEYRQRYELVQERFAACQQKFSGLRLDPMLLAQIACRLTRECGFSVVATICFANGLDRPNRISVYPVPTP